MNHNEIKSSLNHIDWEFLNKIKYKIFPIFYAPIKCVINAEFFITPKNKKYILWTSPQGRLELLEFNSENITPYIIPSGKSQEHKKKINIGTYIPSIFFSQDGEKPIALWDHEIQYLLDEPFNFSEAEIIAGIKYLPYAFNLYSDEKNESYFLEIMKFNHINGGEHDYIDSFVFKLPAERIKIRDILNKNLTINKENQCVELDFRIPGNDLAFITQISFNTLNNLQTESSPLNTPETFIFLETEYKL